MENDNVLDNDQANGGQISAAAKQNLQAAATWVKVVAILAFIGGGLSAIFALIAIFGSPLVGIIQLLLVGAYIYINILLFKKASAISVGTLDMDSFSENFLKYWKYTVIMIIASFVLGVILYSVVANAVSSAGNLPF